MKTTFCPIQAKVKNGIFLLILALTSFFSQAQWVQKGLDIDGEAALDYSGQSVSMPDSTHLAIGAYKNNGNGIESGHVRVYKWNGIAWVQKGMDIDGEDSLEWSGYSVCMPDSETVAIGAHRNTGSGILSGHVRVFKWVSGNWQQKGTDIDGENPSDQSGVSLDMADSNTIIIGAINNNGGGLGSGHARVFRWNGTSWVQKGLDIDGESILDNSGISVNMPDSNTIAIGAHRNDGNGNDAGHVRIYKWNGTSWIQKGIDIDGEATGDWSGYSVSMPDSNTIAIGSPFNSTARGNTGQVRVYTWDGARWNQKGIDIDGDMQNDAFGISVFMVDSNSLAIGGNGNGIGAVVRAGHVRIYNWDGFSWNQKGRDIDGESFNNYSGTSISMSDANNIAIGAYGNSDNGFNSGHARVYRYNLITRTEKYILKSESNIYPNPSNGVVNLETTNSIGEVVQITSIRGAILKEIIISQNKEIIDINNFENGIYFLRKSNITKKIVKID